ncbi:MAG TPA: phage tail tape measure protein, partial [Flavobacterium sp.]|nr:phage tail tape measure protein [Flavobacterium sp.]
MEFKKALSELEAITGATGKDLDMLKEKAQQMSSQYGTSAVEIVNAMKLVGSAKPELLSNVAALGDMTDAVLVLSKASSLDLSESTKALTQIMNQFGVSADQANKYINVLGAGAKFGSVEIPYLNEAIVKVGGTADSAGLSIEQLTAMMELFGEKGVVAEKAGTGFKKILVELQKDTANYENGIFSLDKAIINNKSIAEDNIALQDKFGEHYFDLAGFLFKNSEKFKELTEKITGTNTAFEQAGIVMNNLSADTDKAGVAWTNLMLSIEDGEGVFSDVARFFVQEWTGLLNDLKLFSRDIKKFFVSIGNESDYFNMRVQSMVDSVGMSFGKLGEAISLASKGDFSKFKTLFSDIKDGLKDFSKDKIDASFLSLKRLKDESVKTPAKPKVEILDEKDKEKSVKDKIKQTKELFDYEAEMTILKSKELNAGKKFTDEQAHKQKILDIQKQNSDELLAQKVLLNNKQITQGQYDNNVKISNQKLKTEIAILDAEFTQQQNKKKADEAIEALDYENQLALLKNEEKNAGIILSDAKYHANKILQIQAQNKLEIDKASELFEKQQINQVEYANAVKLSNQQLKTELAIENAAFAENEKVNKQAADAMDFQNKYDTAILNNQYIYDLERQSLENKRLLEVESAEKTGADIKLINEKYTALNIELKKKERDANLNAASQFAGNIATIFGKNTKVGKAAASAQIAIDTYKGAMAAYSTFAAIPPLGIAAAAAVAVVGAKAIKDVWAVKSGLPGDGGGGGGG